MTAAKTCTARSELLRHLRSQDLPEGLSPPLQALGFHVMSTYRR